MKKIKITSNKILALVLSVVRSVKQLTLTEMASHIGISRRLYCYLESGKYTRPLSLITKRKIAEKVLADSNYEF